ncbi:MAG: ATP-binding protein [Limisphaerales bacterium]
MNTDKKKISDNPAAGERANLDRDPSTRPLRATFRHILLVVFLIFIFAVIRTIILWTVCNNGMQNAASLEHQGLPALNKLASLQENLALYRLGSYEYLFAQEAQKTGSAKAAEVIAVRMRAELENIQTLCSEGKGRQLAANLENAVDDLDIQFQKVRKLVDSDFPAAMKSMDQDIPRQTQQVEAAANALKEFIYQFSGAQANTTFGSFGLIKRTAVIFGIVNCVVAFCAFMFVLLAARRSRAQLSHTMAQVEERTAELAYERDLLRALLDSSPDPIYFKDVQSRFLKISKVQSQLFGMKDTDAMIGKTDFDFFSEAHARPAFEDEQQIIRTGHPLIGKVEKEILKDGREFWALTSKMPLHDRSGQIIGTFGISKNITAIKEAEAKLEQLHKQLLETSRQAGMAEIATNVLHNVGNVLNSVNVSASLVMDSVKKSKGSNLVKVVALLREHEQDLGAFFTGDPRGRQLSAYLSQLSEHLLVDQKTTIQELGSLVKNIEHIKDIVTMQQSYARVSGIKEIINIRELVEDGLNMNVGALGRHGVEIAREFEDVPLINIEKHKVLQVLVNLIRNAKHACQDSERSDKRLTVRVAGGAGRIKISVTDNGVGIAPENLTRIFNHGFTTRKDGHGFGLHSGALAAKEMGGSLIAHSDGEGRGATFTLELPVEPKSPAGSNTHE